MNKLFIITAAPAYLPGGGRTEGFFAQETEQMDTNILAGAWQDGTLPVVCRKKGNLIYGATCLDRHSTLSHEQKNGFIKSLFKGVIGNLDDKEKQSITEVYLFAHSFDLDYNGSSAIIPIQEHELLGNLSWLQSMLGKKSAEIGYGEPAPQNGDTAKVYFTAFSHDPKASVFNLLESGKADISGTHSSVEGQLESFAKFLLDDWGLERHWKNEVYKEDPVSLPEGFSFKCHAWDGKSLTDKYPDNWIWKNLLDELTTKAKGEAIVNIVFLPLVAISDYKSKDFYHAIVDKFFKNEVHPTIFVSYWDIMSSHENWQKKAYFTIDRRYRFLDSSIWCRYVPIQGNFWENLQHALTTIKWAYDNRLYQSNVCREYIEFQGRMLLNSHLDDTFGTGHAMKVFPFTFHSEKEMESKAEKTWERLRDSGLKWNMLLVDDYAESPLREGDGLGSGTKKGEIIKYLVNNGEADSNKRVADEIDQVFTVDEAEKKLGCLSAEADKTEVEKVYDIILLDYLFSHPETAKRQHFGTELLDKIKQAKRRDGIGVMQSYWIYPISVFNEAIQSHMQEKGYQYFENYWQFARGADPLNTPHLFRRSLFKFMESQMDKVWFEERDIWEFIANEAQSLLDKQDGGGKLDRVKAMVAFRRFVERFSTDDGMPEKSALAMSIRRKLEDSRLKKLRDHFGQLFYLLGFSVGFDFPVIKQEITAINSIFEEDVQNGVEYSDIRESLNKAMNNLSVAVFSIQGRYF